MQEMHDYFEKLRVTTEAVDPEDIQRFCEMVYWTAQDRRQIFICGNGGSAALASHMAIDMAKAGDDIRVISLTDNVSVITAWANDTSYVEVFSRQLKNLSASGDLVIGISASGRSPNIVEAIKTARDKDCKTAVLTGNAGSGKQRPLHSLADHSVIVDSPVYGIVEDVHCAINHILFHYLHASC